MNSSPRGFAVVISNVNFDPNALLKLDRRNGGEVDEEVLRKVFTELDYLTTVRRDLTAQVKLAELLLLNCCPEPDGCKADNKSAE